MLLKSTFLLSSLSFLCVNAVLKPYFQLQLILIDTTNTSNYKNFTLADVENIPSDLLFNSSQRTVVYSFGYQCNFNRCNVQACANALATKKDLNIIVVDYSAYSSANTGGGEIQDFATVIEYVKGIGAVVGELLWNAFGSGLLNFELLGHSLGAHLSAYINRAISKSPTNSKHIRVPTITALDPAGPLFYPPMVLSDNEPLTKDDADTVITVHTDMLFFGSSVAVGMINFFPNGGSLQPGCPPPDFVNRFTSANYCSHNRASFLYMEAQSGGKFPAVKCNSWDDFKNNNCEKKFLYMGAPPKPGFIGNFYFQTNSSSPFSLGMAGVKFNSNIGK